MCTAKRFTKSNPISILIGINPKTALFEGKKRPRLCACEVY